MTHTSVRFAPGDPEVTVLAQPEPGYSLSYWESRINGQHRLEGDREDFVVDQFLYDNYADGTTFYVVFEYSSQGVNKNIIAVSTVKATPGGVLFTVVSAYPIEVNLECDFSITYDHGYEENGIWFSKTVTDNLSYYTLEKGRSSWEVYIPYSVYLGGYSEVFDNIKYEFSGNNGVNDTGVTIGNYTYYFMSNSNRL